MIRLKRVYDPPSPVDGSRFLVDRVWPRGLTREAIKVKDWLKDVAPSNELRKWFGHEPARWEEFQRRYFAELDQTPEAFEPLLAAAREGDVTLLFSARDTAHNNAVALREYLQRHLEPRCPEAVAAASRNDRTLRTGISQAPKRRRGMRNTAKPRANKAKRETPV